MYNILLFDDRPQVRNYLEDCFSFKGMKVYACRNIHEAKSNWREHKDELDAIVLDMMMPSDGLSKDLRTQTKGGLLTGWEWIWNDINPEHVEPHPAANMCIVIYSAYLDNFKEYIEKTASDAEKDFINQIKRIPKGPNKEEEVIEYVIKDFKEKEAHKESK